MAPVLAAANPDLVVSSAMTRAVQTARPIADACQVPLLIETDLHERKVGALCGRTNAEAGGLWTETLRRWKEGQLDFAPAGAESFLDVQSRSVAVFERLAADHAGRTLIVVAHGHVCRVLLLSLLPGLSMAAWDDFGPIPNMALTELLHSGQTWQALRMNELPDEVKRLNGVV